MGTPCHTGSPSIARQSIRAHRVDAPPDQDGLLFIILSTKDMILLVCATEHVMLRIGNKISILYRVSSTAMSRHKKDPMDKCVKTYNLIKSVSGTLDNHVSLRKHNS